MTSDQNLRLVSQLAPESTRPNARRKSKRLAVTLTSSALVFGFLAAWGPASAWAWGRLGHRVAGRIAEARLTPAAKLAVHDLLDPGQTLADVSTWADEVRRDRPESATWHYVNVPIAESKYHPRHEDPKGGVVSKILDFQKIVADTSAPRLQRQEALKYLVHFLQDMHQPVHVGHRADRGGNDLQVQFFDQGSNLHRVWDSGLIEHSKNDKTDAEFEANRFQDLATKITPELADQWSKGTVEDWANESLVAAKGAYLNPLTGKELPKGAKLGQPYYEVNLPVAELRVEQAGVRLAAVLNSIFL